MCEGRGALGLLNYYSSDNSDDEVPNCKVSTKRVLTDSDEENSTHLSKLPVPAIILNKGNCNDETDDPSLHGGKIRSFPHERGNWATYVFIPYVPSEGVKKLVNYIINSSISDIKLHPVDDFHISLTKTVVLKHHWIDAFVQSVKQLTDFTRFMVFFDNLEVYCNEERTRTFIGLQIKTGFDTLVEIVHCLDNCLTEFKLPVFYEDCSFHMSIAWSVGDHRDTILALLPELNIKLHEIMNEFSQDNWYIFVNYIHCKIGCKMYNFALR